MMRARRVSQATNLSMGWSRDTNAEAAGSQGADDLVGAVANKDVSAVGHVFFHDAAQGMLGILAELVCLGDHHH